MFFVAIAFYFFFGNMIIDQMQRRVRDMGLYEDTQTLLHNNWKAQQKEQQPIIINNSQYMNEPHEIKSPNTTTTKYEGDISLWDEEQKA
jgi:hypothetical protein